MSERQVRLHSRRHIRARLAHVISWLQQIRVAVSQALSHTQPTPTTHRFTNQTQILKF